MQVLDTDLLIAFLNKGEDALKAITKLEAGRESLATTVFNAHEVLYGALLTRGARENYRLTHDFLMNFRVLDYDMESMENAVELKARLKKKGSSIGLMDEMIAGICLRNRASIVTRNKRHFSRVPGLKVRVW